MPKNFKNWPLHLIGGIMFLLIPVILAPQPSGISRLELDPPTLRDLVANAFILGFFYLNYYQLVPKLFLPKKYLQYLFWLAFFLVLVTLIPKISFPNFGADFPPPTRIFPPPPGQSPIGRIPNPELLDYVSRVNYQVLLYGVVASFSILLRLREALFKTQLSNDKAEINALKAQINPHFLFNTLNSIFALSIRENAPVTGKSVLKLSDMMRYVTTESEKDLVSLEKEVGYIESYIELQRLRIPEEMDLIVTKSGDFTGKKIAPLLLIPFVENAFKYGVNPDEKSEIRLDLKVVDRSLELVLINKITKNSDQEDSSGLGIENTKNRLKLIYSKDFHLEYGENQGYFSVYLKLPLSC